MRGRCGLLPWNHTAIDLVSAKVLDIDRQMNLIHEPMNHIVVRPIVNLRMNHRQSTRNELGEQTWIILPLLPEIVDGDLQIRILEATVTNGIRFRFEFFVNELEGDCVTSRYSSGREHLTSRLSDASMMPSLSSSICSWIVLMACRPSRSLSTSVHRLKIPVQSKQTSRSRSGEGWLCAQYLDRECYRQYCCLHWSGDLAQGC